jgi:hypothetical protein
VDRLSIFREHKSVPCGGLLSFCRRLSLFLRWTICLAVAASSSIVLAADIIIQVRGVAGPEATSAVLNIPSARVPHTFGNKINIERPTFTILLDASGRMEPLSKNLLENAYQYAYSGEEKALRSFGIKTSGTKEGSCYFSSLNKFSQMLSTWEMCSGGPKKLESGS